MTEEYFFVSIPCHEMTFYGLENEGFRLDILASCHMSGT